MAKKKQQQKPKQNPDDKPLTLADMLDSSLIGKLKNAQNEMKAEEARKAEEEEKRKREERRLREKNKSFEELLNESAMNWKEFKK